MYKISLNICFNSIDYELVPIIGALMKLISGTCLILLLATILTCLQSRCAISDNDNLFLGRTDESPIALTITSTD